MGIGHDVPVELQVLFLEQTNVIQFELFVSFVVIHEQRRHFVQPELGGHERQIARLVLYVVYQLEEQELVDSFRSAQVECVVDQLGSVDHVDRSRVCVELVDEQLPVSIVVVHSIEASVLDISDDPTTALELFGK